MVGLLSELISLYSLPRVVLRLGHPPSELVAPSREEELSPQADLTGSVHILKHVRVSIESQIVLVTEIEENRGGGGVEGRTPRLKPEAGTSIQKPGLQPQLICCVTSERLLDLSVPPLAPL